jgi:hypothetical protein
MLQFIFDMIAGLLEVVWRVHQKKFQKKYENGLVETPRS